MKVYIVGEDLVTYAIIKRILAYCSSNFEIISELPARGGEVKRKINEFNKLSLAYPVILLTDLDANTCAPLLVSKIKDKNNDFIFNVAVDEAEAWLMADREGFADFFHLKLDDMPVSHKTKQGGRNALYEMDFSYKSSMYLTHELIKKSRKPDFILQMAPKPGAAKGPEYNSCILPFIEKWDVSNACKNTDSLTRMISRIKKLIEP